MENNNFEEKLRSLEGIIRQTKYEISNLKKQYIYESELYREFPPGTIVKVVNNEHKDSFLLACVEKYELTGSNKIKPVLLKVKKDGTPSKHHMDFYMYSEHLEKYED